MSSPFQETPVLASFAFFSLTGLAFNARSAFHIRKTFGLSKAVFALVFVDIAVCLTANAAMLAASVVLLSTRPNLASESCHVIFYANFLPNLTGMLITAEVSVIRQDDSLPADQIALLSPPSTGTSQCIA